MPFNTIEKQKNYNKSIKRKKVMMKFNKKHPNYMIKYRQLHPDLRNRTKWHNNYYHTKKGKEIILKINKKYSLSEKGKMSMRKHQSMRHKLLKFIVISENIINEKTVFHHIDNSHVISIPEDIHTLYSFSNREYHRFMCNQVVKQLYNRG